MAPKRSMKRGGSKRNENTMRLRSGPLKRKSRHEAASSRNLQHTPKKRGKTIKKIPFVDDEAIEEDESVSNGQQNKDSNYVTATPTTQAPSTTTITTTIDLGGNVQNLEDNISKHAKGFGENISLGLMNEVLAQFHVHKDSELPMVPLCRLIPTDAVRMAVSDASWLTPLFDRCAYMQNMSNFIVAIKGVHGEVKLLSEEVMERWDAIWQRKNEEFEMSLTEEWSDLRGKLFHVYDGNHRLKTWMRRIEEVYSNREEYHVSVRCQFVEIEKKKEGEFLLALDSTNLITRATTVPNLGHEIFLFQKFGMANKVSIMERLNAEQRSWMETQIKLESKQNVAPWYSTPCILICQLVWKEKWEKFFVEEESKLRTKGLIDDALKSKLDASSKKFEEKMQDKGYKYLCIANPTNGEEFFTMLFNHDWNNKNMMAITRDKLYCLCSAKISVERRQEILHLLTLTKAKDPKATYFGDYKRMRAYMRGEVYWYSMFAEASLIIAKFEVEGPQMPLSFENWWKLQRKVHVAEAYMHILSSMKSASDATAMPELPFTTKRLLYRWFLECLKNNTLQDMPSDIVEWLDLNDTNTMFSPTLKERGITTWECEHCPWWIEYPLGVIPRQERELHAQFVALTSTREDNVTTISENITLTSPIIDTPIDPPISFPKKKGKEKIFEEGPSSQPLVDDVHNEEAPTTTLSHLSQSIVDRPFSQRQASERKRGFRFATYVDPLLVDIENIDAYAWESIKKWFEVTESKCFGFEYCKEGVVSHEVARLIFADFPTSMLVEEIHDSPTGAKDIPEWNHFSISLVKGVMKIAQSHLADEGFLVTLSLAQHLGKLVKYASKASLALHRSWTLMCSGGYLHPTTGEEVMDLTIGLFYHKGKMVPKYDRAKGEEVDPLLFPANRSCISEGNEKREFTHVKGELMRGGAERSSVFFEWLLATFTNEDDHVIDIFAGCGGLGVACVEQMRHCLLLEGDIHAFVGCLESKACGPSLDDDEN